MPPQPADKWEGVRSSRMFGPTCPQAVRMGWGADERAFAFHWDDGYPGEDCLRVNIWTPGLNDGKKRPVMVWLHGGAEAQALAEKMSGAWLNFARTGNPNAEGLPQWDAYTEEGGATMFFNNRCEVKHHHDKELLEVVRAFPTRGF